jgi:hypothetical protein
MTILKADEAGRIPYAERKIEERVKYLLGKPRGQKIIEKTCLTY